MKKMHCGEAFTSFEQDLFPEKLGSFFLKCIQNLSNLSFVNSCHYLTDRSTKEMEISAATQPSVLIGQSHTLGCLWSHMQNEVWRCAFEWISYLSGKVVGSICVSKNSKIYNSASGFLFSKSSWMAGSPDNRTWVQSLSVHSRWAFVQRTQQHLFYTVNIWLPPYVIQFQVAFLNAVVYQGTSRRVAI